MDFSGFMSNTTLAKEVELTSAEQNRYTVVVAD